MEQRGQRKPQLWSQYLFVFIVSQWTAPVSNTLAGRALEQTYLLCAVDECFCTDSSRWPILSCQAEVLFYTIGIPHMPSNMLLYHAIFHACGLSASQSLWWMVASEVGTILVVPNIKVLQDFNSQTYTGTKWVPYYITGVDYFETC